MKKSILSAVLLLAIMLASPAMAGEKVDAVTGASPAFGKNLRPEAVVKEEIIRWLDSHYRLSLATVTPDGGAYVSGVIYVREGNTVYFMAHRATQKITNIEKNKRVAYTIWDPVEDMKTLKSLQVLGKARILKGEAREKAAKLFKGMQPGPEHEVVSITPALARWTDNSIEFGHAEVVKYKK
jgi:uncharacterized protein YhbP (UPF0306 family)